jgi:hypothetical protein
MRAVAVLTLILLPVAALCTPADAQRKGKGSLSGYDKSARATVAHDTLVYVDPDDASQRVAEVLPGNEIVVIQRNGPWVKVFANINTNDDVDPDNDPEFKTPDQEPASGWIKDKGIVTAQTPDGDAILFGLAATFEDAAEQPHAPKDAATEAHLLYRRVYQYFPSSPLDAEAAYRSADIRWQLEKIANSTLPSAKEQEAFLRPQLYEGELRRVMKFYPNTRWAALSAYDLIDNKVCGDWQGLPKCPEMELNLYLKYVDQYRESPKAPEAMYNAVYRLGVLVSLYSVDDDRKRVDDAKKRTQDLAADMQARFPGNAYSARAASVAYRVRQGIAIYGSDRD